MGKRVALEEVKLAVKKAKVQTEQLLQRRESTSRRAVVDAEEDDDCLEGRRVKRRVEEKVSEELARLLGVFGPEEQAAAFLEREVTVAQQTAEAIEQQILPELERLAGTSDADSTERSLSEEIHELQLELDEERAARRAAQTKAFVAEQELARWVSRWQESELDLQRSIVHGSWYSKYW